MRPEGELLLQSYDAFKQATGAEAKRLWEIYQSRLDDALTRHPISKAQMQAAVDIAYNRWLRANARPTSIPPKA